ncbi:hypothetical protein LCGC14_1788180 [marine sediment metagenome]|uniref:Uncharacterized protein n=1 Tax=marine sediment metagenome TaxID=412755 RepID=A0A0F9J881_9ZZZZ
MDKLDEAILEQGRRVNRLQRQHNDEGLPFWIVQKAVGHLNGLYLAQRIIKVEEKLTADE